MFANENIPIEGTGTNFWLKFKRNFASFTFYGFTPWN